MIQPENSASHPAYQIMADQPDCCGKCGSRLELVEMKIVDQERVFVSWCLGCHRDVWVVED